MNERRGDWITLGVLLVLYLAFFAVFYPPLAGIEDEVGFINQALMWKLGGWSAETAGIWPPFDSLFVDGHHVPFRSPGRSLLLLPFLYVGFNSIFWTGPLIHISTVLLFARLCRHFSISPLWAALVLLHPTLLIYSRTIMADELAGLLLLASFYLFVRKGDLGFRAGLPLGFGFLARSQMLLTVPLILSAAWLEKRRSVWRAILFAAGAAVLTGAGVAYSLKLYSQPVVPRTGLFGAEFIVQQLPFYLLSLTLLWPGMLIAPVAYRGRYKWFFILLTYPHLALFSIYYFRDDLGEGKILNLIIGMRFLQIALPIWILAYALWISEKFSKFKISLGLRVAIILLASPPLFFANSAHDRRLQKMVAVKRAVESNIPENSLVLANAYVSKLIAIPTEDQKRFRVLPIEKFSDDAKLAGESEWYIAFRPKGPVGLEAIEPFIAKYLLERIQTSDPELHIYRFKLNDSSK
ncbi:MAG: hypothetical protein ABL958_14500 [Bdellovibrionia bacterium]